MNNEWNINFLQKNRYSIGPLIKWSITEIILLIFFHKLHRFNVVHVVKSWSLDEFSDLKTRFDFTEQGLMNTEWVAQAEIYLSLKTADQNVSRIDIDSSNVNSKLLCRFSVSISSRNYKIFIADFVSFTMETLTYLLSLYLIRCRCYSRLWI